jgi:drug/metabolite transporter (DMT)-like permease
MILGYLLGLLYALSVALSTIWLHQIGGNIPASYLLFIGSILTIVCFNLLNIKNIKISHTKILKNKKDFFIMSSMLIGVWFFSYYTAIESSAKYCVVIVFFSTYLSSRFLKKKIETILCLVTICIAYLITYEASIISTLSGVTAGICTYIYYKYSCNYSDKTGASAIDILATRFYLMLFFSLCIFLISNDNISLNIKDYFMIFIFCLSNMVIPMFLSQSSLQTLGHQKFSLFVSLIPFTTFITSFLFLNDVDIYTSIFYLISTILFFCISNNFFKYFLKRK